jgi:SAM-dependent methyltransferase
MNQYRDQQELSEAPLLHSSVKQHVKAWARYQLRRVIFRIGVLRRIASVKLGFDEMDSAEGDRRFWNDKLSKTSWSTYLGGTIEIELRNSITSSLIKLYARENPAVLDVGCAGGTLPLALPAFDRYLGVDISDYAIGVAKNDLTLATARVNLKVDFIAADIRYFKPDEYPPWDVILFNELLYYFSIETAIAQVVRYARALRPDGIICISMKDDPKSHAIFAELARRFQWKQGVLWQAKHWRPDYRITISRERPSFLIGVLIPRSQTDLI